MRSITLTFLIVLATASAAMPQNAPTPQPVLDPSSMDTSVDPCTDFYLYSCANWMKKNPVPPDQSNWSAYSKLQDETLLQLKDILETAAKATRRNAVEQKIGDYYAACMDEPAIEKLGTGPLEARLKEIAGLQSKKEIAGWIPSVAPIDPRGRAFLFGFHSEQDFKDSAKQIAVVDQGGLGLPDRDFYLKTDEKPAALRKAYTAHVQKMFELLGDSPGAAETEAAAVLRIETALAQGTQSRVERRNPSNIYHPMSTRELAKLTPAIEWKTFFRRSGYPGLTNLNVASPGFFKSLNSVLKQTSLKDLKSYFRWHLVHASAQYLPSAFVNEDFAFYGKTLQGQEQIAPRWKRCTGQVDDYLGEALGQLYVEKYFPPEAKQRAATMVQLIEAAMEQDIRSLPWMSDATRTKAFEKLHAMTNKIGYPEKWRDYSSVEIRRDDAIGNAERALLFEYKRDLAKIGQPVDRTEWHMTPPTVNAEYTDQTNDMNFPAGILQPPLFDSKSDDAPNYGNTGGTIGHELTHGFDDEGRRFDAAGNLKEWWTPEDGKEFEKRAACISDQYSGYTIVDDIKINGRLTLGEDVADLGGLILAYRAWQAATKGQQLQPIDGFTPEQRFFIGYAQSWCTNERPELKRVRALADPHSPEKYRANGVVSNLPEFQEAFHCKAGSPMVNAKRCSVW